MRAPAARTHRPRRAPALDGGSARSGPPAGRLSGRGAADRLGADVTVSTSGVVGTEPVEGQEPGTLWIGIATPDGTRSTSVRVEPPVALPERAALGELLRALECPSPLSGH
ncbi:MAG: CinA family protein [Acidimicrobiia bacterium]